MSADEAVLLARAAWSRVAEPGDEVAGALIQVLGPVDAWRWLSDVGRRGGSVPPVTGGDGVHPDLLQGLGPTTARRVLRAVDRWVPRAAGLDPRRDVEAVLRLGGHLLVPEGPGWPAGLDDLGAAAPACLWVRGRADLAGLLHRSVAIIGARASTPYGDRIASELAQGLADAGWSVVSGGAYGIDAAAHRAVVAVMAGTARPAGSSGTAGTAGTVAFLAGGVDRLYPAGNARLLAAIVEHGGALASEVPPGCVPSRSRFLQRNRLIATADATVVVEAAWRSGALSTAGHAATLLRPVGAVPGPVTSAASAGCHRLLREGVATCVTDVAEVVELVGATGRDLAPEPAAQHRIGDDLPPLARRVLEALPLGQGAAVESVTRAAGLSIAEVRAGLGTLEVAGHAVQDSGRWRRST